MFSAMGNLCCNLLIIDMCLKFGVLQKLASHRSPSLSKMVVAACFDFVGNPNLVSAHILFVFKCGRGCVAPSLDVNIDI
jgi:hypothetical protein